MMGLPPSTLLHAPVPFCFEESIGHVDNSIGRVDDSVGRVHGMGSFVFVPSVIESIGDVVPLRSGVQRKLTHKIFCRRKS